MRLPARLSALFALAVAVPLHAQAVVQAPVPAAPAQAVADTSAGASSAAIFAAPASAAASTDAAAPVGTNGASLTGLRAGVHHQEAAPPSLAAASHVGQNQARAMMIVGVAGLIVGAIIGGTPGTVIMVGGAVVGLVGLYDYMQ